ncbi:hypothetical protein [Rhizobium sp. L245/93]|uniref:hypothetical protein n=1 Tax=Rhizobium sp. L245/93 TaxID=2819998 RepID=UPI001ADB151C|nr:hypothetical protein [Rhizobium sp. L245/93]MBO9172239.1 hypothetical protein [Rhizobium sp. L245/93]
MKLLIAVVLCFSMSSETASATWFARIDSGGKLIVTGVATNPDTTNTAVYLTCSGKLLTIEVLTINNAQADDLPTYRGTKIILGYKTRDGDQKKMGLDAEPIVSAGGALSIRATITEEQSAAIYTSVARGTKLDVELVHPELSEDTGIKRVLADGFSTTLSAMAANCPGLGGSWPVKP